MQHLEYPVSEFPPNRKSWRFLESALFNHFYSISQSYTHTGHRNGYRRYIGSVGRAMALLSISYQKEKKRGEIMYISILSFKLSIDRENIALKNELLEKVKERKMAPYYREVCNYFDYKMDVDLYNTMKEENDRVIKEKSEALEEIEKSGSDDDIIDVLLFIVRVRLFVYC